MVTESSAALDALSCGCKVIIPRLFNIVDMNPLSGLCDLSVYANSPQELLTVTQQVLQEKEDQDFARKSQKFIYDYCEFVGAPSDWGKRLERIC